MNIRNLEAMHGVKSLVHNGVTWLDIERPNNHVFNELEKDYGLHPVHLQESVQKVRLTEIEREKSYLFMLLHAPRYDAKADKIVASQIGVFLGKDFLLTIHDGVMPPSRELFGRCERDSQLRDAQFKKGSSHLLYFLIREILESVSAGSEQLLGELDNIEDSVFNDNGSDAYQVGRLRQKIIRMKRVIGPMRLVLKDLGDQINEFSGQMLSRQFANNTKLANKLWEVMEEAQETIEIFKDADFTISTEKTNKTLAVLTLLFTLTIPATVIASIYGMNVTLPGGIETGSWTFLGSYTVFKLVVGLSALAAIAMYAYFRRKHWF